MAKLVDALVSGTSVSNDVQVRVLFWAPTEDKRQKSQNKRTLSLNFYLLSFILILAQMVKLVDTPA
jgi:hypothetical protein